MGNELRYTVIPLFDFEAGLSEALGSTIGKEITALYGWFAGEGCEYLAQTGLGSATTLGMQLTTAAEWSRQQDWSSAD